MDVTRNLERGHMITFSFGQQMDQDEHQESNTASLATSIGIQESVRNPGDQVLPGEGKVIKIFKPTLPQVPVTKLPCAYLERGCKKTFLDRLVLEKHTPRCIFSLFYACKDPKCHANPIASFKSLDEVVQHALDKHGCVPVEKCELVNEQGCFERVNSETYQRPNQDDDTLVPITLERQFFTPTGIGFASKVIATYEKEIDKMKFRIAFFAVILPGKDYVFIIPVVYGEYARIWNYGRVKLSVINHQGTKVRAADPLTHPSHRLNEGKEIVCLAFTEIKSLSDAFKKNTVIKFSKADLISIDATKNQAINFTLSFKAFPYRCIIDTKMENKVSSLPRFLITQQELGIREDAQKLIRTMGKIEDKLSIPGILVPFLRTKLNLMVECTESELILSSVMASCVDNPEEYSPSGARQPTVLLLFPSGFMLEAIGATLHEMAKSFGLVCTIVGLNFIDDKNDQASSLLDNLMVTGCNILATTPNVFLSLYNKNMPELNLVLLMKIKLVAFPNSDYLLFDSNRVIAKNCIKAIQKEANRNVHRIAFCPLISHAQNLLVKMSIFGEDKPVTLFLGTDYSTQVAQLPVIPLRITDKDQKVEIIINLLRTNPTDKRWLIITSKTDPSYNSSFISLIEKLKNKFPERRNSILWRNEKTDTDPSCFDQFKNDSRAILLTTYYALQYDATKSCDGIILFGMPGDDADIVRIVPLVKTLDKPIYSMRDSWFTKSIYFQQF